MNFPSAKFVLHAMMARWGIRGALVIAGLSWFPDAAAPAQAQSASICLYASETYSEGAYLCVRKGLLLGCSVDAGKASWKVVSDGALSSLCTPDGRPHAVRRPHGHRRSGIAATPPVAASAKCFVFNGQRYCE